MSLLFFAAVRWSLKASFIKILDQFWRDLLNVHFYEMVETLFSDVFFKQTSLKIDGSRQPYFIASSYYFETLFKTVLWEWILKRLSIKTGHPLIIEFHFSWEIDVLCTLFKTFSDFCFVVQGNLVWFSWWRIIIITSVALDHYLHRYQNAKAWNNLFIWFTAY